MPDWLLDRSSSRWTPLFRRTESRRSSMIHGIGGSEIVWLSDNQKIKLGWTMLNHLGGQFSSLLGKRLLSSQPPSSTQVGNPKITLNYKGPAQPCGPLRNALCTPWVRGLSPGEVQRRFWLSQQLGKTFWCIPKSKKCNEHYFQKNNFRLPTSVTIVIAVEANFGIRMNLLDLRKSKGKVKNISPSYLTNAKIKHHLKQTQDLVRSTQNLLAKLSGFSSPFVSPGDSACPDRRYFWWTIWKPVGTRLQ